MSMMIEEEAAMVKPVSGGILSNGSSDTFNFDILNWTDQDRAFGVSTQETFDSRSTFKLRGGTQYANNNRAQRGGSVTLPPSGDLLVYTFVQYHHLLADEAETGSGASQVWIHYPSGIPSPLSYSCVILIENDVIGVLDSSASVVQEAAIVPLQEWYNLTVAITKSTKLCDIYYNDLKVVSGFDCGWNLGVAAGEIYVNQTATNTTPWKDTLSYVDQLIVGDGFA